MNKGELISAVSEKAGVSKRVAEELLSNLTEVIGETVATGSEVRIPGFGSFKIQQRAARQGRNPKTGEPIDIPASKNVVFKASKTFKESLN